MESVSLTLADDHPLIQLGFRGRLRLGATLEVRISGTTGRPDRLRYLPERKYAALLLIAEGCDPAQLADRLDLCLERAEALHEELSRKMGLDRIARQVRTAIRSGALGPRLGAVAGRAPMREVLMVSTGNVDRRGGRMMADQDLVRTLFPSALARCQDDGQWGVVPDPEDPHLLGRGTSEPEAWSSAAAHLCEDEWFRPILARLIALQPGRRAET